ncbi:hypothetical protein F53441_13877 [Fusarium austroafricanum]|uniref:Uncharacterized protein n=1 Tax=Fusarium austroafricanum TaxID=2364996 RepID=A0A8H4JME5_9HYPO|nr:hypothetical protein F53441_13877 [Fusarium austroafricanum]
MFPSPSRPVPSQSTIVTSAQTLAKILGEEKRTLHTFYRSDPPVEIQILSPPILFRENFTSSTSVMIVQGVRVLHPTLLLNAKCKSILGRVGSEKKDTDSQDIVFLLQWCASNNVRPRWVANAGPIFVQWFIQEYGNERLWSDLGFDLKTGKWSG